MPNHVTNKVTVHAKGRMLATFMDYIAPSAKKVGLCIDFDKIIPRPKSLNVESNGTLMFLENEFCLSYDLKKSDVEKWDDKTLENFIKGLRNFKKYGHATWYGWSCQYWGTKWNAYDQKRISENCFQFDTAWSMPEPVFRELSFKFPDVAFTVEYADEDIGRNCGVVEFLGGVATNQTTFAERSEKANIFAKAIKNYVDD